MHPSSTKKIVLLVTFLATLTISGVLILINLDSSTQYSANQGLSAVTEQTLKNEIQKLPPEERSEVFVESLINSSEPLNVADVVYTLNDSLTERFLRLYDERIGLLNQDAGIEERQAVLAEFVETEDIPALLQNYPQFSSDDLSLVEATDTTKENYKIAFEQSISINASLSDLENEFALYRRIQNQDLTQEERESLIQKIEDVELVYITLFNSLISQSVPTDIATQHIDLMNSLSGMIYRTQGLQYANSDPLRARFHAEVYKETAERFLNAWQEISAYIERI